LNRSALAKQDNRFVNPPEKRRARFRRGFTPPPLDSTEPESLADAFLKRVGGQKGKGEPRKVRERLPLPEALVRWIAPILAEPFFDNGVSVALAQEAGNLLLSDGLGEIV
jgi:hypothetical protein